MHPSYLYNHTPPTYIYPLSLHDALPISMAKELIAANPDRIVWGTNWPHPNSAGGSKDRVSPLFQVDNGRSEEHTSELQSRRDLVCRLLLEKKKNKSIQF